MKPRRPINELYVETNLSPTGISLYSFKERSAVNAVSIVTGVQWETVVKSLMEQVHFRCNMPSYQTCITDLFRANGFTPDKHYVRVSELLASLDVSGVNEKYIVKFPFGYFAVVKDIDRNEYVFKGNWPHKYIIRDCFVDEIWLYIPGTDNRTGIKRDTLTRKPTEENKRLKVKNMNPDNKNVGDCVIRGFSAAYGCTWHEAIDYIADSIRYSDPVLNIRPNTQQALINLGFERHNEIKRNKKLLTGKQFCELMEHTYFQGERIFAYVGKHHCAAILPEKQADGSTKYVIQDTWDSTNRRVYEYFVYKEIKIGLNKNDEAVLFDIKIGESIRHPQYGIGKIIDIKINNSDRILYVDFEELGIKRISEKWILSKLKKETNY